MGYQRQGLWGSRGRLTRAKGSKEGGTGQFWVKRMRQGQRAMFSPGAGSPGLQHRVETDPLSSPGDTTHDPRHCLDTPPPSTSLGPGDESEAVARSFLLDWEEMSKAFSDLKTMNI